MFLILSEDGHDIGESETILTDHQRFSTARENVTEFLELNKQPPVT